MADAAPLPAKSRPLRVVEIPDSFRIEAVDDVAEAGAGHELRKELRDKLGLPEDVSVLHPDQPSLRKRAAAQPTPKPGDQKPILRAEKPPVTGPPDGALGIALSKFVGEFNGNGFNMISRPQNGAKGQPGLLTDNLVELNFTHETMTFLSEGVLSNVPNRGFNLHPDVNLRGIPYTQRIKDLTNSETGKADLPIKTAPGIHFEQGLFMRTPAVIPWKKEGTGPTATFTPGTVVELPPIISRMASIPHGTTINAQALDPEEKNVIIGAPVFKGLDEQKIRAFPIGTPAGDARDIFPQARFRGKSADRIPMDLEEKFEPARTINEREFLNPDNFLEKYNSLVGKKNILKHITFQVDTKPNPTTNLWGGGTDNIQQLGERFRKDNNNIVRMVDFDEGNFDGPSKNSTANASAVQMTCRYWISDVEDTITVPAYKKADLPRINNDPELIDVKDNIVWPVVGPRATEGIRKPYFKIMLPENKEETKAKVVYTQIQYSQNVSLNFGPLTWPHISVATLIPAHPVEITEEKQLTRFK